MNSAIPFSKREFLKIALSFLAILAISPSKLFKAFAVEQKIDPLTRSLSDFFTYKKSAAVIGKEYLKQISPKISIDELVNMICSATKDVYSQLARDDLKELRKRLKSQVRLDFKNDQVVKINGWALSYTEANLCALAYLTSNQGQVPAL